MQVITRAYINGFLRNKKVFISLTVILRQDSCKKMSSKDFDRASVAANTTLN